MKKTLLFASLLMALTATSQEYQWQWAKTGGGIKQTGNETEMTEFTASEQIFDIAVDAENNNYYLAYIGQNQTQYDGMPITVYNGATEQFSQADILLISTDCEGILRWTQTIGGGTFDDAYNIQLDNNGGLYIAARVTNAQMQTPPHFSPDDAMEPLGDISQPNENFKSIALLKYNTSDGTLAWRVMPQGLPATFQLGMADISQIQVDSQGIIHTLMGLQAGAHLNGEITVPDTFIGPLDLKYYIVKYNSDGDMLSVLPLTLEGVLLEPYTTFRYDEGLGRYYIAGRLNNGGNDPYVSLSFNGMPVTGQAYLLAFNINGTELWRNESSHVSQFNDFKIDDLEIDTDHSLYMSGRYFNDGNTGGVGFGNYEVPNDLQANNIYAMKMNSSGVVQWMMRPSGYNVPGGVYTGMSNAYDLDINGNEVVVASQINVENFGDISFNRPTNHRTDPALLFVDKATGEVTAVKDVMGHFGYDDVFTAVQLDNDGNYLVGGCFHYDLFTAEDDNIPTIHKVGNQPNFTDFLIAKYANVVCGTGTVGIEEVKADVFNIYPNPASGMVSIQTQDVLSSYEVVNMLGQVLLKGNFEQSQNHISIESLSAGTYIITVKTIENKSITRKIVKE